MKSILFCILMLSANAFAHMSIVDKNVTFKATAVGITDVDACEKARFAALTPKEGSERYREVIFRENLQYIESSQCSCRNINGVDHRCRYAAEAVLPVYEQ